MSKADTPQLGHVWVLGARRHRRLDQQLLRAPGRETTQLWSVSVGVEQHPFVDQEAFTPSCDIRPTLPRSNRLVYHSAEIGELASSIVLDHEHRVHVPRLRPVRWQPLVC